MSAKRRNTVRRPPANKRSFDERLWPVNLALFLFGGFLVGVAVMYLRFDDPRWYANAWVWVAAIPVIVLASMLLISLISNRLVRRSVQLAVVLSLMLHLVFLFLMVHVAIFARVWPQEQARRAPAERQELIVPDYYPWQLEEQERPRQDFEEPLATETPEPELEQVQRREQQTAEMDMQLQPTRVPEREQTVEPQAVRRQPMAETVPRYSEQASLLTRHELPDPVPVPRAVVEVPRVPAELQTSPPDLLQPQNTAAARQAPMMLEPQPATQQPVAQLPVVTPTVPELRQQTTEQEPSITQTADALPPRQPRLDNPPEVDVGEQIADVPQVPAPQQPVREQVASAVDVARRSTSIEHQPAEANPSLDDATPATRATSQPQIARQDLEEEPGIVAPSSAQPLARMPAATSPSPATTPPDQIEVVQVPATTSGQTVERELRPLGGENLASERLLGHLTAESPRRDIGSSPNPTLTPTGLLRAESALSQRQAEPPGASLPQVTSGNQGPLPRRQLAGQQLPPAALEDLSVHVPLTAEGSAESTPRTNDLAARLNVGPLLRTDEAVTVDIDGPIGPGGLGEELAANTGINNRRAQTDSLQVTPRAARFRRQEFGGLPEFNTTAVIPADAFRQRHARQAGTEADGGPGRPGPETEEAIERGLVFLQRQQLSDGSWTLRGYNEEVAISSDTAATGLALLAFQGAGYNHREHRYADVVARGLEFLVNNQQENGDLFRPLDDDSNRSVWLYSHSIAALALCEAYGMTQDPQLKAPAQKALDFIVASQHTTRGGWRYLPNYGSDTSVTGWMMMALKSGELANLHAPQETYEGIEQWLDLAQFSEEQPYLYRYNPFAPDTETQRHGRSATPSMTSVGLLMRLYSGWQRDDPHMIAGAEYLLEHPASYGTSSNPLRDTYYWYYATQVLFHLGGTHWEQWNERLHPLLIQTQAQEGPLEGSWDPRTPVPDRWGPHAGRLYVTTMNLLSLEVYYRYLPLYQQ